MRPCPMRFAGYTWHHNPKELKVKCGKTVVKVGVPYFREIVRSFSKKLITVSGTGELYGEDCLEQYKRIKELYEKGEKGILCLPQLMPIYACFDSLVMHASTTPSVITYSFSFTQVDEKEKVNSCDNTFTTLKGQTLWDISYISGVSVEKLRELNPHIMFINDLKESEVIRLC